MPARLSRRAFLRIASATAGALALGPPRWGWAVAGSPFGPLQHDPLLRLPEGFEYKVIAVTGHPLRGGRGPFPRPEFPDLNVVFPQSHGRLLLSTSHEVQPQFPVGPPPGEEYDGLAGGAITSLLLNPDLSIAESAYNAGGMLANCSGSGSPWGTVLTGEEDTTTFEADHGFVWEVDVSAHTKTRLDACGRFEHETAVVDPHTGYVYLTEDSGGDSLLYRMRPAQPKNLAAGGVLEAFAGDGRWVRIADPTAAEGTEPSAQGLERGALAFDRLEGGQFDGRWFYFAETEDTTACGRIWRLNVRSGVIELFAQGTEGGAMCMPDNVAFDAAGNLFVTEDKGGDAARDPNRVLFIDRETGEIATFAQLPPTLTLDEPTGPAFSPDGTILFLNLQRSADFGVTLGITGPFARRGSRAGRATLPATPAAAQPDERRALADLDPRGDPRRAGRASLSGVTTAAAAVALVSLRRRQRVADLPAPLEDIASDLGPPPDVDPPLKRGPSAN